MSRLSASLMLDVFDGARRPLAGAQRVLIRLMDGGGRMVWEGYRRGPSVYFRKLPVYGNFRDSFKIILAAPRCLTTGFAPVHLRSDTLASVDLMLLPQNGSFDFRPALWRELEQTRPRWARLLERDCYEQLMERRPAALAGLLNLLTALEQTPLGEAAALDYLAELIWDPPPAQDRFFAWATTELLDAVHRAVETGHFAVSVLPGVFHPGATASFREIRFPVGNLQLTFHAGERRRIQGVECLKVEPDIDYYRDPLAHALLEVLPNTLLRRTSDPRIVYMLRWTATRRTGAPEFAPPYAIA